MIKKTFILLLAWEVFSTCHKIKPEHIQREGRELTGGQEQSYAYPDQYHPDPTGTSVPCPRYRVVWKGLSPEKKGLTENFFGPYHTDPVKDIALEGRSHF